MPEGYVARQCWAQAHLDAGLRQQECGNCGLWKFPHELSGKAVSMEANTRKDGRGVSVTLTWPVCKECAEKHPTLGRKQARRKPGETILGKVRLGLAKAAGRG